MFFCIIVSIALTSYLVYAVYFSRFNIYGDQGFYCDEHVKQDWKLGKFFKDGPLNVSSDQFMNRYKRRNSDDEIQVNEELKNVVSHHVLKVIKGPKHQREDKK